jgi:hypothetical protein
MIPTDHPPSVLMIGDIGHRDFADAVRWLRENTCLVTAKTAEDARLRLDEGLVPTVILCAQSRPGQIAAEDVERLHAASPLSRLVALLGSWCEGELRTGRPCPGLIRVFWHQWQPQIISQLLAEPDAPGSTWRLPRTSSESERLAGSAQSPWPTGQGLVAIQTPTRTMYEALRDVCRSAGYSTAWLSPRFDGGVDGVRAVIWDGVSCDPADVQEIQALTRRFTAVRLVVLLDFARVQDDRLARAAGATAVLAKPVAAFDLLWHLENSLNC